MDGKWSVTLSPLKAGGPYTLVVSSGKQKLTYGNVLAGEVWLCSGQSNMEFYLNRSATAKRDVAKAANDNIRLFDMKARWRTDAVEWNASVLDSLNHCNIIRIRSGRFALRKQPVIFLLWLIISVRCCRTVCKCLSD